MWTKRAADAAKKTAIVATEALHLTERADVLFETQKYLDTQTGLYSAEINPTTEVVFVERNYGRTRAKNLQIGWCMYIEGDPVPEIVLLPPLVLGPGAPLETRIGMTIGQIAGSTDRYNAIGEGTLTLKSAGALTFVDVFGKRHQAKFRGTFRPRQYSFAVDTETTD